MDIVNRLLQDTHVNPSALSNLAIRVASEKGYVNVVDRLLQDPRVDLSNLPFVWLYRTVTSMW